MRSIMSQMCSFWSSRSAQEEGTCHYAQHFAKCTIVKRDNFNKMGSDGPHGDYLSLENEHPSLKIIICPMAFDEL